MAHDPFHRFPQAAETSPGTQGARRTYSALDAPPPRGERTDDFHNLPPGPNNPVGILWAGLNRPGIGIHGSPAPDTIGRAGSHGCIRLSNWDAATFYTLVGKGSAVTIR
ncbi:MAG: L,D-transpeptidase [Akkermansiaceae bacterium]|nr:L,D-transpeptidase [Akkermansiaceae bacterium]MDP4647300.1 L,D-transpeptidase [Akkermansiaceae bacterium]MDP4721575.1 L,D-transpeptidase [Akkermansiaceae bacterium]MDP4847517.1 L,D-transpeptidase [Akkermansiaceae bacterium]MDP4898680.1 L,D-transpeptidase [Akkermansiaceae bacterium]